MLNASVRPGAAEVVVDEHAAEKVEVERFTDAWVERRRRWEGRRLWGW